MYFFSKSYWNPINNDLQIFYTLNLKHILMRNLYTLRVEQYSIYNNNNK